MSIDEGAERLNSFLTTGIYQFHCSDFVFVDPVRILSRSYTRFQVLPAAYYSRFFHSGSPAFRNPEDTLIDFNTKKRKRKGKVRLENAQTVNAAEEAANIRHQKARPMLAKAHELLLMDKRILEATSSFRNNSSPKHVRDGDPFVELSQVWQAPLYEITLNLDLPHNDSNEAVRSVVPLFNNFVRNTTKEDVEANFLGNKYLIPKLSSVFMSDLSEIGNIIPDKSDDGYNIILIDPPWENASATQKRRYKTLPNRYFLGLPVMQLAHTDGALVALWVTNKEKLRKFVENELFPSWGVSYAATLYWLKIKPNGCMICDLDHFHHRPYECLLLGYTQKSKGLVNDKVVMSIPGDHSRKPPLLELLFQYAPGKRPPRCVELFARELVSCCTSWGNQPLHFQHLEYFEPKA